MTTQDHEYMDTGALTDDAVPVTDEADKAKTKETKESPDSDE